MDELTAKPVDAQWRGRLRRRLLAWYDKHARDLPWRQTSDPYRIWVSEIMLQQTQVATVIPYYERFLERFSDVGLLAGAAEEDVLRHWEGLGYYRRARQLHRAARMIVDERGGLFPDNFDDLLALPGVGRYTAGAVASFAWDDRQPILEANTTRLFARLLAWEEDVALSASRKRLWEFAAELLPRKNVGRLNQALMELGAEVCTPRDPSCETCPMQPLCPTWSLGWQDRIPAPKKKMKYTDVRHAAVIVWRGPRVLVRRNRPDERWAGLWDFPRFELPSLQSAPKHDIESGVRNRIGATVTVRGKRATIRHGVTRFRITLDCYDADCRRFPRATDETRWVTTAQLNELPLSVTGRKISDLIQDG
ncbi:MAG: A/G-specific adenine glycosylase [Pirellulaceae bacterium]|nr:A/G-specific adenine glycosylase [Pirellulaceae bacterium]